MTPSGIESATIQLVVLWLNQLQCRKEVGKFDVSMTVWLRTLLLLGYDIASLGNQLTTFCRETTESSEFILRSSGIYHQILVGGWQCFIKNTATTP
jgi:hypothetical protein